MRRRRGSVAVAAALSLILVLAPAQVAASHSHHTVQAAATYFSLCGDSSGWYWHSAQGHYYTYNTNLTYVISCAAWYLPTFSGYAGNYRAYAYMPCDGHNQGWYTRYHVLPYGTWNGVYHISAINQSAYCNIHALIINRHFDGSQGGYVKIVDNGRDAGQWIVADDFFYQAYH